MKFVFLKSIMLTFLIAVSIFASMNLKATQDEEEDLVFNKTWRVVKELGAKISYKADQDSWKNDQVLDFNEYEKKDIRYIYGKASLSKKDVMFIAFRGTDNTRNWIRDGNILLTSEFEEEKVHPGFKGAYDLIDSKLEEDAVKYLKTNKSLKRVVFTGHSLGGALATLAVLKMSRILTEKFPKRNLTYYLITFGSPRVGSPGFATKVNNIENLIANVRFIYGNDVVTKVPNWRFHHVGSSIHFKSDSEYDDIECSDTLQKKDCEYIKKDAEDKEKTRRKKHRQGEVMGTVLKATKKLAKSIASCARTSTKYVVSLGGDHSKYINIQNKALGNSLRSYRSKCKQSLDSEVEKVKKDLEESLPKRKRMIK